MECARSTTAHLVAADDHKPIFTCKMSEKKLIWMREKGDEKETKCVAEIKGVNTEE